MTSVPYQKQGHIEKHSMEVNGAIFTGFKSMWISENFVISNTGE